MAAYRCASCGKLNRLHDDGQNGKASCGACGQALDLSGGPQEVSYAEMEKTVRAAPVPVLVDFWAPWCGPCRMAAPIIHDVAKAEAGRLVVLKVNTDEHPDAAGAYGVQGIPTFVIFRDGQEAARQVGVLPREAFRRWVQSQAA